MDSSFGSDQVGQKDGIPTEVRADVKNNIPVTYDLREHLCFNWIVGSKQEQLLILCFRRFYDELESVVAPHDKRRSMREHFRETSYDLNDTIFPPLKWYPSQIKAKQMN